MQDGPQQDQATAGTADASEGGTTELLTERKQDDSDVFTALHAATKGQTLAEAQARFDAFFAGVADLRIAHGIPTVGVIVSVPITRDGVQGEVRAELRSGPPTLILELAMGYVERLRADVTPMLRAHLAEMLRTAQAASDAELLATAQATEADA